MRRHVGARARDAAAASHITRCGIARKSPCGEFNFFRRHASAFRGPLGCELCDLFRHFGEAGNVCFAEGDVVALFTQNDVKHGCENRRIFAGPWLKIDIGEARDFGLSGIDHDELESALLGVAQSLAGIRGRDSTGHRDERIIPDEHPNIGLVEDVRSPKPAPVNRVRDMLAGLIDGRRGEDHA